MRRKDREMTDIQKIQEILSACQVISIAFSGETPYVIPMSFGYVASEEGLTLYMHGAHEGEKINRIKADPIVAFSMYTGEKTYGEGSVACTYSASFDSVCGEGEMHFAEGEEKVLGLAAIMAHYMPGKTFDFDEKMLKTTCVIALKVRQITGKHHD